MLVTVRSLHAAHRVALAVPGDIQPSVSIRTTALGARLPDVT